MADNTAYKDENVFHAGIIREDCSPKPVYKEIENMILNEWNTSFEAKVSEELRFSGFYGEYEIEIEYEGKKVTKTILLSKDNTGYDNRLIDFRKTDIYLE